MGEAKQKQPFLERMKEKWGLNSIFQVVLILIVFALTGMTVVWLRPIIFQVIGIENANGWLKTVSYLVLVFPLYQVLLLAYGFCIRAVFLLLGEGKEISQCRYPLVQPLLTLHVSSSI